jgi:hypothetical protein
MFPYPYALFWVVWCANRQMVKQTGLFPLQGLGSQTMGFSLSPETLGNQTKKGKGEENNPKRTTF